MPDNLKSIVQRMIDAGESEENIGKVIQHFKAQGTPAPEPQGDTYAGPDTFWGGVMNSLNPFGGTDDSGSAIEAGGRGALGWLKGATIDLPGSIVGGLQTIGNTIADPIGTIKSIPQGLSNMWDTTMQAGSDPEAFGRMTGQLTGQPLVTAGIAKGAPLAKPYVGSALEGAGSVMRRYQPVSGFLPRLAEGRTLRNIERGVGGGLERLGQRMQTRTVQGEVVPPSRPAPPPFTEGEIIDTTPQLGPAQSIQMPPPTEMPPVPPEFIDSMMPQPMRPGLPPAGPRVFEMPEPFNPDVQSPTAGSHMNSPATPHNIPEAPITETPKTGAPAGESIFQFPAEFAANIDEYANQAIQMFGSPKRAFSMATKLSKDTGVPFLAQEYWKEVAKRLQNLR